MAHLPVVISQTRFTVGAIEDNARRIIALANEYVHQAPATQLVVFPEQALLGAPAFDLLLRSSLASRVQTALEQLTEQLAVPVLVGLPTLDKGIRFNSLALIVPQQGVQHIYHQQHFADQAEDDGQARAVYFSAAAKPVVIELQGVLVGLLLGDDYTCASLLEHYQQQGVQWLLHCANNVFTAGEERRMYLALQHIAQRHNLGVLHCSTVGGQDALVFQGGAFAINASGALMAAAPLLKQAALPVDLHSAAVSQLTWPQEEEVLYQVLVRAVRDYVHSNGFAGALLGLSGGIDSSLTLAVAADALGPKKVRAIMMPFDYTSAMSKEDAALQAATLGVAYEEIPIRPPFDSFTKLLAANFSNAETDTTEENLQARCRGVILMALSNKHGQVVLACSNKSETAVGYSTLYGDMVGGFCPLRDVPKTWVYRLAKWRNGQQSTPVIPWRVIERPPTAELAPGQLDQNSLPDYAVLDEVVHRYVELHQDVDAIVASGLPEEAVRKVVRLIDRNEYKRQQGALGPKVTGRGFGANRRYPVTYRW